MLQTQTHTADAGPHTIELPSRTDAPQADAARPPRELAGALAAERLRVKHIRKALACTRDARLRQRWQADVAESVERMQRLERLLRAEMRDAEVAGSFDDCLLEAMELARANGDSRAAETVAVECLALVELHCQRIRRGEIALAARPDADARQGANRA